jgi:hypothetical protein
VSVGISYGVAVGLLVGVSVDIAVALAGTEVDVGGLLVIVGVTELVDESVAIDVLVCRDVGVNAGVLVCVPVGVIVAASSETTIWTYTLAPKGVPFLSSRIQ